MLHKPSGKRRLRFRTIDKVHHDGHFYSSKPPLFPTLVAGVYAGVRAVTGWNLVDETEAVQAVAQAKPTETAPKATTADNEAFARAAAQRSVDSQRTRALLDTIAPVNNSAVEAAKSYVSKVEPDAPEATASKATAAAKPALDKAA